MPWDGTLGALKTRAPFLGRMVPQLWRLAPHFLVYASWDGEIILPIFEAICILRAIDDHVTYRVLYTFYVYMYMYIYVCVVCVCVCLFVFSNT